MVYVSRSQKKCAAFVRVFFVECETTWWLHEIYLYFLILWQ